MWEYKILKTRVLLEVLQKKKCGVNPQFYLFLRVEFLELRVFGNVELERSYKSGSGAVPNTPESNCFGSTHSVRGKIVEL